MKYNKQEKSKKIVLRLSYLLTALWSVCGTFALCRNWFFSLNFTFTVYIN